MARKVPFSGLSVFASYPPVIWAKTISTISITLPHQSERAQRYLPIRFWFALLLLDYPTDRGATDSNPLSFEASPSLTRGLPALQELREPLNLLTAPLFPCSP